MPGSRLARWRSAAVALGLALLVAACAEEVLLGPEEILGAYEAVTADGRPLPTYVNHDRLQLSGRRLARAELRLTQPAMMDVVVHLETVNDDGVVIAEMLDTLTVDYALDGAVLTVIPGDDLAFFDVTDHGLVLEDGSLLVIVRFRYPQVTGYEGTYPMDLVFER